MVTPKDVIEYTLAKIRQRRGEAPFKLRITRDLYSSLTKPSLAPSQIPWVLVAQCLESPNHADVNLVP